MKALARAAGKAAKKASKAASEAARKQKDKQKKDTPELAEKDRKAAAARAKERKREEAVSTTQRTSSINKSRSVSASDIMAADTAAQLRSMQMRIDDMNDGIRKKMMQDILDRQMAKFKTEQSSELSAMQRKQQQSASDRRAKAPTTRKAPFDIPEDAKGTKGLNMAKGGVADKPMNAGMKALKKKAPEVAKKMGYRKGGMANCGASMKPAQGSTKSVK